MTQYKYIEFEQFDGVAKINLNRPDVGNALNLDLCHELAEVASICQSTANIGAVCLTANGDKFCVGGDLLEVGQNSNPGQHLFEMADALHIAIKHFSKMPAPLLISVDGVAAGAGFSLALCADILLVSPNAKFVAAYSNIGFTPDGGLSYQLPRLVGMMRAKDLLLSNQVIGGKHAQKIGIATHLVSAENLTSELNSRAVKLSHGARNATAKIKGLLGAGSQREFYAHLDKERDEISAAAASPDGREGVLAFLEQRNPNFSD